MKIILAVIVIKLGTAMPGDLVDGGESLVNFTPNEDEG